MISKFNEAFEKTKIAGSIAAGALDQVSMIIKPGISTNTIDKTCYDFLNDHKAYSAPLYYRGFPKSCCASTNHIVCHGVPSDKILKMVILLMLTLLLIKMDGMETLVECLKLVIFQSKLKN